MTSETLAECHICNKPVLESDEWRLSPSDLICHEECKKMNKRYTQEEFNEMKKLKKYYEETGQAFKVLTIKQRLRFGEARARELFDDLCKECGINGHKRNILG